MAYDRDYADRFLEICEKHKLAEWADELKVIGKVIDMDIEDSTISDIRSIM